MSGTDDKERDEIRTIVELVNAFHERDVHLPTRTIFIGSEEGVDALAADLFVKNMHILESMSAERITVIINSIGGDEYHGFAMYDAIKQSPCKVKMIVRGHAMSMGSILLQAADERVMGPLSVQMIHYGTWGFYGHAKTADKWLIEGDRINKWMEQLYLEKIREVKKHYPLAQLKKLLDHDTFLTPEQSIELGLADCIG